VKIDWLSVRTLLMDRKSVEVCTFRGGAAYGNDVDNLQFL